MQADDVVLLVLPLCRVYGLNVGLDLVARTAASGGLCARFDPVETLQQVRRHRVTNVLGAPLIYVGWALLPCARSLARFTCPTVVEVQALPDTATGVSKGRLREPGG